MASMSAKQIDALAVAFTVFASLWLLFAVSYMGTVCLFFRMRSRGLLRGSMSDPTWGRVYLFGSSRRYYISLGWLFRRYVMYQRSGAERERIAKIRVMSVEERRAAIKAILRPSCHGCGDPKLQQGHCTPTFGSDDDELQADKEGSSSQAIQCIVVGQGGADQPQTFVPDDGDSSPDAPVWSVVGADVSVQRSHCSSRAPTDETETREGTASELLLVTSHTGATTHAVSERDVTPSTNNTTEEEEAKEEEEDNNERDYDDTCESSMIRGAQPAETHDVVAEEGKAVSESKLAPDAASSVGSVPAADSTTNDEDMCLICFSEYTPERPPFDSPKCTHRFHWDCILSWLEFQSHRDCPCCRKELISEEQIWRVVRMQRKKQRRSQRAVVVRTKKVRSQQEQQQGLRRGATEDEDDDDNEAMSRNEGETTEYVIRVPLGDSHLYNNNNNSAHDDLDNEFSEISIQEATSDQFRQLIQGSFDLESHPHSFDSEDTPDEAMRPQAVLRPGPMDLDQSLSEMSHCRAGAEPSSV